MNVVITGASSGIGRTLKKYFNTSKVITIDRQSGYDLRTQNGMEGAIQQINLINRSIDLLINNAGTMLPFEERMDWGDAENMIRVNLMAVWFFLKFVPIRKGGNIINIASIAGINNDGDTALYSATKAGVISLTKAYAKLYAKKGIRVNSISPGLFDTNLVPEKTPEWLVNKVPLGYEEKPEKICRIVDMILNTEYMTGANIIIDGGLSL